MTMQYLVAYLLIVATTVHGAADFIRPCRRADPSIDQCLVKSISYMKSYLIKGIPEYGIPSIEPLVIPKIAIENGVGSVRVKAQFQNISVVGLSNHTIEDVRANVKNYRIVLTLSAPHLEATGRYDVSGVVLLFNIRSKGEFWAGFDNAVGVATIFGKEVTKDGVKYMKVDRVLVDFKVDRAKFRIKDGHNRNKLFGEAMNNFLNNNWREILDELKITIGNSFSKYVKTILNGAFLNIPLNEWLLDD